MSRICCTRSSTTSLTYDAQTADYYHPGRSARAVMDGALVAQFGQIHPDVAAARKLRQDCFHRRALPRPPLPARPARWCVIKPLPRYPAVERDFSLSSRRSVFEQIHQAVAGLRAGGVAKLCSGGDFSRRARFRRASIPSCCARRSNPRRTLREEEVAQMVRARSSGRTSHGVSGGTMQHVLAVIVTGPPWAPCYLSHHGEADFTQAFLSDRSSTSPSRSSAR